MNPPPASAAGTTPALLGRRLLALAYDALPVVALWMLVGLAFTIGHVLAGHPPRQNITPFSPLQWLLWLCCWLVTGGYAVLSWRRGGQTLGMRPWRLQVTDPNGRAATTGALWARYAIGTLSLLAAGLGFWWAWLDRERLTWHDRFSATRVRLRPKRRKP